MPPTSELTCNAATKTLATLGFAQDVLDAQRRGGAFKHEDKPYRVAHANKAFAHYRCW